MEWKQFGEALVPKAVETAWDSTKASLRMDENHTNLDAKMMTLLAARDDLKDRTNKYRSTMKRSMDDWFQRVNNVEKLAQELESCFSSIKDTSWIHVFSRSKLSNKMTSLGSDIDQLVMESNHLWNTLVDRVAERVLKMTTPDISYIQSQQDALNQILEHLPDEDYRAIRVLGMSGAGKTTILKNLNNHKKVAHMYERVIWVTVSGEENLKENLSIEKLQYVIAERLKVDMEGTTDIERVARKIKEELEGVKFLLLLDDVKAELDLPMIGIPEGAKGSKVVMTTKYKLVTLPLCYNIEVKMLSSSDSWNMFHKLLDFPNHDKEKPRLDRIARKALEICDGLPLMIKMAASVFRTVEKHERNENSWSDALQTFKKWPEKREDNIMGNLLKFCCDHLDRKQKRCFLYTALHPEDTEICMEGLLECWAAENFLESGDDAKVVGRNIMRHLKSVILLEDGATGQFVRMHKVIRAIALNILTDYLKDRCLVRTSVALQKPIVPKRQRVDLWTDKEWISLANDSINISPEDAPRSKKLTTLFVQKYSMHKQIPDSFFQHMHSLLVLNLYKTEIMTLPSSIHQLSNLKVLYLNGCRLLKELPSLIGLLKSLEVLDIRGSGVCELSDEIKCLTRLRRLLLSFTISTRDNHDVIFKLSRLEELIIDVDSQAQQCSKLIEDLVEKACRLPHVLTFQLCFLDKVINVIQVVNDTLNIFMPSEHHLSNFLERRQDHEIHSFQVFIGCLISDDIGIPEFRRYDRYVKYYNGRGYNDVINNIVLNKVQAFELINHNDIEHLSSNAVESMNYVEGCLIDSCYKMTAIVVDDGTHHRSILPNMERLDVKNLPNLESIVKCPKLAIVFSKLKTLVLVNCPKLTTVFPNAIVHQLTELENLEIQDCCMVEEIVKCSQDVSSSVLPKLTTLILCKLPGLRKISTTLVWSSLRTLKIHDCPKLKDFPFNYNNARTLQKIEIEKKCWEELRWADSAIKEQLESFCFFRQSA